ncbi:hypothetical protein Pcinc_033257 [Petrolisthes cinctipes]|uniref:RRM domain-containing protein n=1 Tax=Petrolisthes cinctipes TaxID=88211 RepID=A0AAE1ESN8_PETCI|nr:hypothetical protein Pcinc_033257 [Petrolisthes cinctipes]
MNRSISLHLAWQDCPRGVGFIRFDQRIEAERAIQKLNGTIPEGAAEPITVKFANNPSNNNKAVPPLAAYLSPLTRRYGGPIHHPAGRFRYISAIPVDQTFLGVPTSENDRFTAGGHYKPYPRYENQVSVSVTIRPLI